MRGRAASAVARAKLASSWTLFWGPSNPFLKGFFLPIGAGFYLTENVFFGPAARLLSPSGRCSLWAMRPGLFSETFLFALRALFSSGPAARAFLPSGHSASGGELFVRPKSSSKTAPSGGPAGPCASLATLLELSSAAPISEGRGALCEM